MRDSRNWIIALLLALLGSGYLYAIHTTDELAAQATRAKADHQAAQLESQGWLLASEKKSVELDLLRAELEAAREVGTEPAVRGRVVTVEVPVEVPGEATPCPPVELPASNDALDVAPGEQPLSRLSNPSLNLPPQLPLFVSARTEIALDLLADKRLTWAGSTEVTLRRDQDRSTVVLPIDPSESALEIGERLRTVLEAPEAKRVAFGLRRPRYWRTGWTFGLGVSCSLRTLEVSAYDEYEGWVSEKGKECGAAAGVLWGVQF